MEQSLLVIKGSQDIVIPKELDDFYIIKADSLYDAAIEKLDIEFNSNQLIERIVYIDSDNFKYSGDLSFISSKPGLYDLVTPQYNYTPYRMTDTAEFNKIVIPDPSFFMCGSYTFNILSSIHPDVFNTTTAYPYYVEEHQRVDNYNEQHLGFFTVLSSMDINIIRA